MKQTAEPRRPIDFSRARRGPVVKPQPGKSKISIRLDNEVLEHFRSVVEQAGGGNYQSLINDALRAYIQQQSVAQAALPDPSAAALSGVRSPRRQPCISGVPG